MTIYDYLLQTYDLAMLKWIGNFPERMSQLLRLSTTVMILLA